MGDDGMIFMGGGDPASMMVGMAVGRAVGNQAAGMINNAMNNPPVPTPAPAPLPPAGAPPVVQYNVVVNGQTTGPFDMNVLRQMAQSGQLAPQSQVWKQGMQDWAAAGTIQELNGLFASASGTNAQPVQPNQQQRGSAVHVYNEKDFYSMDRLMAFGMSTSIAEQMASSMNHAMKNMYIHIPGFGNQAVESTQKFDPVIPGQRQPELHQPELRLPELRPPDLLYYVMIDGNQAGPFCETELARLINDKKVCKDTYIWHTGLCEWKPAEDIPAVLRLVALAPPPPPVGVF